MFIGMRFIVFFVLNVKTICSDGCIFLPLYSYLLAGNKNSRPVLGQSHLAPRAVKVQNCEDIWEICGKNPFLAQIFSPSNLLPSLLYIPPPSTQVSNANYPLPSTHRCGRWLCDFLLPRFLLILTSQLRKSLGQATSKRKCHCCRGTAQEHHWLRSGLYRVFLPACWLCWEEIGAGKQTLHCPDLTVQMQECCIGRRTWRWARAEPAPPPGSLLLSQFCWSLPAVGWQ